MIHEIIRRLRFLLHRDQFERDLDDEIRLHLELRGEESGSPHDAQRRFGNVTLLKEESRARWTWTFWEQLAQDLRYGLRTMAAHPLFTAMAVLSLALGIGANTAIYSFMDAILMRSLPVQKPEQLVVLNWRAKSTPPVIHGHSGSRNRDKKMGIISPNFPYGAFEDLRSHQDVLSTLFAYANAWQLNLVARGQADVSDGQLVSGGFYRGLGVPVAVGRPIGDEDDRSGAPPVAVISYRYWQRCFEGSSAAIGEPIRINDVPFTVIGVASPEFCGVKPGANPDVYLPLHAGPLLSPKPAAEEARRFLGKTFYWVEMMGRLQPGVSKQQAQAVLAGRFRQYADSTAATPKEHAGLPELWLEAGAGGLSSLRRQYSQPLYVLMAMVGLILTLACANIANLLLSRCTARRREMALRLSLGAGRMRIVRQLLTESVLLSMAGAVLGLFVAMWGIRTLTWLLTNGDEGLVLHAGLNGQVLTFTLLLAIVTGIVFGLAPALQATKVDLTPALKESRAGAPPGRNRRFSLGRVLAAGQIALSLLLVVAAGLFVRTLSNLYSVDLGFSRENILLFSLDGRSAGYKDPARMQLYAGLLRQFRAIPGVRQAGMSQYPLVSGSWNSTKLQIPGATPPAGTKFDTAIMAVDPGFLPTLQIPILLGTGIEDRHLAAPKVAVVTEQFVKKFFNGENPVGRRIGFGDQPDQADIEIVGVAKTTLYNSIKEQETPPLAYVPYTQNPAAVSFVHFELRTGSDPLALVPTVREIVRRASPNLPIVKVMTQAAQIDQTINQERTFAQLCLCFAILALAIACVGLYGTMAYTVARRTSEIGIRMALGAERAGIIWMVLREVFVVAGFGLTIGLGIAWGAARFVESFLFGMKAHDPLVMAGSAAMLIVAALAAGYAPAWRASRIDPLAALRQE